MINDLATAIQRLPSDEFWLYFIAACLASLACLYLYFRYLWRYRIMQDTPTALIRSASQGYNEFEGIAKLLPGEPIIAPLTKQRCVWYQYSVEEKRSSYSRGRRRVSWHLYDSGVSDGLFALQGRADKAIVDPDDAEIIYSVSDIWYGNTPSPVTGPRGYSPSVFTLGGRYRYSEHRIQEGDDLYVLGDFKSFREVELPSNNELLGGILKRWKMDHQVLLKRFDKDQDGSIDSVEWEKAVLIAKQQLAEEAVKQRATPIKNVIEKPADSRRPFLISTQNELELTRKFKYKSFVSLSGFIVLGVVAIWSFNVRF